MSGALLGASSVGRTAVVSIPDATITDVVFDPADAATSYSLTSAGGIESSTSGGGTSFDGSWVTPTSAAGARYDVKATYTGDAPSGSLADGTWLSLASTRSWSRSRTITGFAETTLTVTIRDAASGNVLDSATIILHAEVDTP